MVGELSSIAIKPLPFATIALAVAFNSAVLMTYGPPGSAEIGLVLGMEQNFIRTAGASPLI
jgi:hypothetical protein